jgi:acylphosphatase
MPARLEIRVTGRVQGVGFRWSTRQRASELGLVGWVRNLPDGGVRIRAEGDREDLERLLQWLSGSSAPGWVRDVESNWSDATGEDDVFRIVG